MSTFASLANEIDAEDSAPSNFADLAAEIDHDKQTPSSSTKEHNQSYVGSIKNAWNKVADTVTPSNIKPALGEAVTSMVTSSPISLLKHGVEEGAYLSGQDPKAAAITAQRVIPSEGVQPVTPAGQAVAELGGALSAPLVDAGKWIAKKAGLSPAAQNIAGDFAPVTLPQMIAKAPGAIRGAANAIDNAPTPADLAGLAKDIGSRGSLPEMQARYQQLVAAGKGAPQAAGAAEAFTAQQARGQEPAPAQATPAQAPPISIENASPELQKMIKDRGASMDDLSVRRYLEADSLPVKVGLTKGQATGDIHQFSDEWNNRGKQPAIADRLNAQNGELIQNINAIRDRVAPQVTDVNHVDNGAALIDTYKTLQAAREAQVSANYKALADANNGAIPVDGKAFVADVNQKLGSGLVNKREFLPSSVENIVQRIGNSEQQMTFDDFTTLRTILAKEAMKATRAGDGNASHAISLVRNALEDIPLSPEASQLKPLADVAKNSAKALFKDVEADPAWEAAINAKVAPDDFIKKFVVNGKRDYVTRMQQNIGADPVAQQTIAAGVLNYLKRQAGIQGEAEGNFSAAGYNKALEALRPKLDYLLDPVSAQQVDTLGRVARYALEQKRGSYVNNSNTAVSLMKDAASNLAESAINIKTLGSYGVLKGAVQASKASKAAAEAVKPGAGIPLKELK